MSLAKIGGLLFVAWIVALAVELERRPNGRGWTLALYAGLNVTILAVLVEIVLWATS